WDRLAWMQADIDRVLISQHEIAERVRELALQITADHAPASRKTSEAEITIIPILTGAFIFCADLIRHMPIAMKIGLITVSSYPGKSTTSQGPAIGGANLADIKGRHVLLVDDILDSGNTIRVVVPMLQAAKPDS